MFFLEIQLNAKLQVFAETIIYMYHIDPYVDTAYVKNVCNNNKDDRRTFVQ